MKEGQEAVVRVVALQKTHTVSGVQWIIQDIFESHEFDSSFIYKDGRLKAAIAHRIVDGLETLDTKRADKLEIYLIKKEK